MRGPWRSRSRAGRVSLAAALAATLAIGVAAAGLPARADEPPVGDAAPVFDPLAVADITLTLSDEARAALDADPTEYVTGTFSASIGGVEYGPWEIGVKLKGHATFRTLAGKAAFKLKFNHVTKSRRLLGLKKLTLNNLLQDPSGVHESLSYDVFRHLGIAAPRTGYARVSVNGQAYGLYANVETMDDVAMARWFPATSHLYEGEFENDLDVGHEADFGVEVGSTTDRSDLTALMAAAAVPGDGWRAAVDGVADLDQLVRMWAAENYLAHWDGYAWGVNNYFLHVDADGRFTMHPWGTDQTLTTDYGFGGLGRDSALYGRCMADAECRREFATALASVRDAAVALDLGARATARRAVVRPEQLVETRRESTMDQVDASFAATMAFIAARPAQVDAWVSIPLAVPTGLQAWGRPSGIELAWAQPPATGPGRATDVEIQVRTANGPWRLVDDGVNPGPGSTVTGLRCCRSYQVRVRARSGDAVSAWSAPVTARPVRVAGRPWPPRLVAWRASGADAELTWSLPLSDGGAPISGFVVQVARGAGAWEAVAVLPSTARSFVIGPRPTGSWRVRVAALNEVGRGGWGVARRRSVSPV